MNQAEDVEQIMISYGRSDKISRYNNLNSQFTLAVLPTFTTMRHIQLELSAFRLLTILFSPEKIHLTT
jgi:hypothetical protein